MRLTTIKKMAATSVLTAMVPFVTLGVAYADATGNEPVMAKVVLASAIPTVPPSNWNVMDIPLA